MDELMGHPRSGFGQVFSSLGSAVLVIHSNTWRGKELNKSYHLRTTFPKATKLFRKENEIRPGYR